MRRYVSYAIEHVGKYTQRFKWLSGKEKTFLSEVRVLVFATTETQYHIIRISPIFHLGIKDIDVVLEIILVFSFPTQVFLFIQRWTPGNSFWNKRSSSCAASPEEMFWGDRQVRLYSD